MIILSIDSSTPVAGVAIVDEEKIWAETFLNTGYTHSEQLLPMINETLKNAKLSIQEIEAFVVTKGPGSFTGLRIGMATVKGFAQVLQKKLIGVSTLDALAYNLWGYHGIICPILNARRNEVYTAFYQMGEDTIERISDYAAIKPQQLIAEIKKMNKPVCFLGDGVLEYRQLLLQDLHIQAQLAPFNNLLTRASSAALLGLEKLKKGGEDDLYTLEPFYLRKSEAEIKWEAKQCQTQDQI